MNSILIRDNNSDVKNNYKIVLVLILFIIFKIFALGVYLGLKGYFGIYEIFIPLIFYFIYFMIEYLFFKLFKTNIDNYSLVLSLIIAFITPVNTPIYIFIISGILGTFISYLCKNKINSVTTVYLLISLFMGNNTFDNYDNFFSIILIVLCIFSFIYLFINKLIKWEIFILLFMIFIVPIYIIGKTDISVIGIILFSIIFIFCDNRYTPITDKGMFIYAVLLGIILSFFEHVLDVRYYLSLSLLFGNVVNIFIKY